MSTDGASNSSWKEVYARAREEVMRSRCCSQCDLKSMTIEKLREEHAAERFRLLDMVDKLQNEVRQRQNIAECLRRQPDESVSHYVEQARDFHRETMVELRAIKVDYVDARRSSEEKQREVQQECERMRGEVTRLGRQLEIQAQQQADIRRQLDAAIEEKKRFEFEADELRCRLDVEIKKNKTQEDEASQLRRVSTSVSVSTSREVESVVLNSRDTLHFGCVDDFEVALTSRSFGTTRQRATLPLQGGLVRSISIRRSNAHDRRCVDVAVLLKVKENWYINLYNINTTTNEVTSVGQMAAEDGQLQVACDNRVYFATRNGPLRLYSCQFGTCRDILEKCNCVTLRQLHSVPGGVIFRGSDRSTLIALDGNGKRLWRVPVEGAFYGADYTGRYCATVYRKQLRVYEISNNDLKLLDEKKGRIRVADEIKGKIRDVEFFPSKSLEIARVHLAVFYETLTLNEKSVLEVYEIKGHEVSTIRRIIVPISGELRYWLKLPEDYTEEASICLKSSKKMWLLNTHSRTFDALEFTDVIIIRYDYDCRVIAKGFESTVVVSWPSANEGV